MYLVQIMVALVVMALVLVALAVAALVVVAMCVNPGGNRGDTSPPPTILFLIQI